MIFLLHVVYSMERHAYQSPLTHGESNEVGAQTKAGTLTGRNTNRGRDGIQNSKHNRGQDGEGHDLLHWQRLLRDEDRSSGDDQTLNQILDNTINNFSESVAHHCSILNP